MVPSHVTSNPHFPFLRSRNSITVCTHIVFASISLANTEYDIHSSELASFTYCTLEIFPNHSTKVYHILLFSGCRILPSTDNTVIYLVSLLVIDIYLQTMYTINFNSGIIESTDMFVCNFES